MINNIIFLKPILRHQNWGTNDFKKYGYSETIINAGELLLLTDDKEKSNYIVNSSNKTSDLSFLYRHNKKFYNSKTGDIPIEIKIINTNTNLDINFSPSNYNSRGFTGKKGMKKYWISLSNNIEPNILFGRKDIDKEKLFNYIQQNNFEGISDQFCLNEYEGIFIDENSIYSLNQNALIYEISLKNATEYNLSKINEFSIYEKKYIFKSLLDHKKEIKIHKQDNNNFLINNNFFKVRIIKISGVEYFTFKNCTFAHVFINKGSGKVNEFNVSKGSNFIVKENFEIQLIGTMDIIVTYIFDY